MEALPLVGILPPLLHLGHSSGTAPGLVVWLPPYPWSRNMAKSTTVACRKTQGANVLGIASFPQTTRAIRVVADAGISVCASALPLCQLLLSQALSSESVSPGKRELLCGSALPSPHSRVGGTGVGTEGWGHQCWGALWG